MVVVSAPRSLTSGVAVIVTDGVPSICVTVVGAKTSWTLATSLTLTGLARTSAKRLLLVLQLLLLRPLLGRLLWPARSAASMLLVEPA